MKSLGKGLLVVLLVVLMCGLRAKAKVVTDSCGRYVYFTQDRNVTNINTQLPAKKGLLNKGEDGIVATGSYLTIEMAPEDSIKIIVEVDVSMESGKITFRYGSMLDYFVSSRVPLFQQMFTEDPANTHVYVIFLEEVNIIRDTQEIIVIKADSKVENGRINVDDVGIRMKSCYPEDMRLSKILKKYNALMEFGRDLSKNDKSEMERALDNTLDNLGKIGTGAKVVKGVIKYGMEKAEEERIKRLQEKYGKDCQIYKMPFYSFEGTSLKYINIGRLNTLYFDASELTRSLKIFVEVPQMMFSMDVPGAMRKASLEGLVYEVGRSQEELNEALIVAARRGSLEEVKRLVGQGANVNAVDENGLTALMEASTLPRMGYIGGYFNVVKFLLEEGANVNAVDKYGKTALFLSSYRGHLNVVKFLLEKGANVDTVDKYGRTMLIVASDQGHLDIVEFLLEKGARVNAVDGNGGTALMSASYDGHLDIVKLLLEKGANVNAVDEGMGTALMNASFRGHSDVVNFLLESGADVSRVNPLSVISAFRMSYSRKTKILDFLLKNGMDMGRWGGRLISAVALREDTKMLDFLIKKGADINGDSDFVPLIHVVNGCKNRRRNYNPAYYLLVRGAKVSISDSNGETPLKAAGRIKNLTLGVSMTYMLNDYRARQAKKK